MFNKINYHTKLTFKAFPRYFEIKNVGLQDYKILKLDISGMGCVALSFAVESCETFILMPNESKRMRI